MTYLEHNQVVIFLKKRKHGSQVFQINTRTKRFVKSFAKKKCQIISKQVQSLFNSSDKMQQQQQQLRTETIDLVEGIIESYLL